MPPSYIDTARAYCEFVKACSGGEDGVILKEITEYERTLKVKRKLSTSDLKQLAKLRLHEAPRYIPAMVKAMLNAPASFVNPDGSANLWSSSDYNGLSCDGAKKRGAVEANGIMQAANDFVHGYSTLGKMECVKHLSELEVRLVMHNHNKKSDTRSSFESYMQIAKLMHTNVSNAMSEGG